MTNERWYYQEDINELFSTLKDICSEISEDGIEIDEIGRRIRIVTPLSLLSYGERIDILVNDYKNGVVVTIEAGAEVWFNITSDPDRYVRFIINKLNSIYSGEKID